MDVLTSGLGSITSVEQESDINDPDAAKAITAYYWRERYNFSTYFLLGDEF